jgi:outer membrane receptor protein involved in Fe transport
VRWLIGARWDDIDPIGSVVSPRTSLIIAPNPQHSFRLSFNRAFRAPSMINNFLDTTIINAIEIGPLPPLLPVAIDYVFPIQIVGNPNVTEEQLDAYEVGWVGTFGNANVTLALYENEVTDSIDFFTSAFYSSFGPAPPDWPLPLFIPVPIPVPPFVVLVPTVPEDTLPAQSSYRNIGEVSDRGLEFSVDVRPSAEWSFFFNYSWQDEPEVRGIDPVTLPNGTTRSAINSPPEHRANLGFAYNPGRWFFNVNANYQDEAFWTDVLDSAFWGPTDAFTMVNVGVGVRFNDENVQLSVNAQNVFDEDVQQHIFGDLIEQKLIGQLLFRF